MRSRLTRTLVKALIASLIVGTVLAHFGVSFDQLLKATHLSTERLEELARRGLDWLWPTLLLGSLVIIPIWFVIYIFRPPGESREDWRRRD